ncbi:MAG: stage III sporulation protein SpoIIIAB [Vulcanibacillus sp.]
MLKLIGATLIIVVSTFAGFYIARTYKERPLQLRILQQAFQMLETEIVYGLVALDIIMKHIGDRLPKNLNLIFLDMSENLQSLDGSSTFNCWKKAIDKNFQSTELKKQDKEILVNFGQTLGCSDRDDQMKHIRLTIKNLETEEMLAREEQKTYEGLSKNIGILLGILVVILIY